LVYVPLRTPCVRNRNVGVGAIPLNRYPRALMVDPTMTIVRLDKNDNPTVIVRKAVTNKPQKCHTMSIQMQCVNFRENKYVKSFPSYGEHKCVMCIVTLRGYRVQLQHKNKIDVYCKKCYVSSKLLNMSYDNI
jgi:hypothetical protein